MTLMLKGKLSATDGVPDSMPVADRLKPGGGMEPVLKLNE